MPQVAGVPGVTEELFQARQSALAEERSKLSATPMLYGCALCGKEYRSSKAHAQHLKSRTHTMRASQELGPSTARITTIKPFAGRTSNKATVRGAQAIRGDEDEESEESEDEWVEANSNDELDMASESLSNLHVGENNDNYDIVPDDLIDEAGELDTSCCFICDVKHESIETCMIHMHKQHGFFIPDVEYLRDPKGLLTYVGLKVDVLLPFYGKQLVATDYMSSSVELGSGGSELIISRKTDNGVLVRTFGSREFLRYYRQKPRPSLTRDVSLALSLASRYRSMGLATVQSKDQMVRMKVMREMSRHGVEAMRSKIGMKSNVIRNLPNNVPY
ncbi:hypothetical protein B296_00005712 [Ensete ventricosum]|uniref:C2H2-type domain-containing protein n=1 Tax=Ensete ventricosum TaxID=4639 RepID=A0A426Z3Q7_ENSVE|nr:hypothetical protein B296_00005712 [Ensete ventricosum]